MVLHPNPTLTAYAAPPGAVGESQRAALKAALGLHSPAGEHSLALAAVSGEGSRSLPVDVRHPAKDRSRSRVFLDGLSLTTTGRHQMLEEALTPQNLPTLHHQRALQAPVQRGR